MMLAIVLLWVRSYWYGDALWRADGDLKRTREIFFQSLDGVVCVSRSERHATGDAKLDRQLSSVSYGASALGWKLTVEKRPSRPPPFPDFHVLKYDHGRYITGGLPQTSRV